MRFNLHANSLEWSLINKLIVPCLMLWKLIVTYWSLSPRDCSCQNPSACISSCMIVPFALSHPLPIFTYKKRLACYALQTKLLWNSFKICKPCSVSDNFTKLLWGNYKLFHSLRETSLFYISVKFNITKTLLYIIIIYPPLVHL